MARTHTPQLALEPPCLVHERKEMRGKAVKKRIDISKKKTECTYARFCSSTGWSGKENRVKAEGWLALRVSRSGDSTAVVSVGSSVLGKEASDTHKSTRSDQESFLTLPCQDAFQLPAT